MTMRWNEFEGEVWATNQKYLHNNKNLSAMTTNKQRSTVSYWHEFPDGSDLKVNVFINGKPHLWHIKGAKDISEDTMLEVVVIKSVVDSVMSTPIGNIPSMRQAEKKEFEMTFKQYKEFITKFWENGHEYYDQI